MSGEFSRALPTRADAATYINGLAALGASVVTYVLGHATASGLSFALWFVIMLALAVRCGRHVEQASDRSRWTGLAGVQVMWFRLIFVLQLSDALARLGGPV